MQQLSKLASALLLGAGLLASNSSFAACKDVTYAQLQTAASAVVRNTASTEASANGTGGFGLNMWVTMVDETGTVCHVVNTGTKGAAAGNSQWLGSRVISAQKANTANAFSLDDVSISTGSLYAAVQPGGSLFGLQESNPVDATKAYDGPVANYGKSNDPLKGNRVGGVNVFGGGIALYNDAGTKIGAIGVSGDTSCTDHAFAWKVREALGFGVANTPGGFETLTVTDAASISDLGDHPACYGDDNIQTSGFGFVDPL